ncbi:MAG: extracellular solute-binding protein, partial [Sulfobacillus sp.]
VQALQTWINMIHKYKVSPPYANPIADPTDQALVSNSAAMIIDGPWDVSPITQTHFPLGTTVFPKGTKTFATNLGTDTFYIFKSGSVQEQASWQFIQWFMQPQRLAWWDIHASFLPTLKSVLKVPSYKSYLAHNPLLNPLVRELAFAHGRPSLISYNAISAELGNEIEAALYGKISASKALHVAAVKARKILQQNHE